MGVDVKITLAPGARLRDVADVAGIAAGLPGERRRLTSAPGAWYLNVPGATVRGFDIVPGMAEITLTGPMVDGQTNHSATYHFEWDGGEVAGCTGIISRSNPLWIAVGRRLVDFFGGTIDYDDCDGVDIDYAAPIAYRLAEDGEPWQAFQQAMSEVEPITADEMAEALTHAAYRPDGQWR